MTTSAPGPTRMPTVFVGHGNPMNAVEANAFTDAWRDLAESLPRPRAILAVSAHWYVPGGRVTAHQRPPTLHDFGGFPRALHEVEYPAPGSPELAARVAELLAPTDIGLDTRWGLDHGAWSVLVHMYPKADIPVVQLGLDETRAPADHLALARALRPLRDEGVLVLGSGNVVHNLHAYAWAQRPVDPYDWAARFDGRLRELILDGRFDQVAAYDTLDEGAALAVPTPEHYLPLLYTLGAGGEQEPVTFPVTGFDGGSISMLAVRLG